MHTFGGADDGLGAFEGAQDVGGNSRAARWAPPIFFDRPVGPANDALQFLRDVLERSLVATQTAGDAPGSARAGSADAGSLARRRA